MRLALFVSFLASLALMCMSFNYLHFKKYEIVEDYAIKFSTKAAEGTFADLKGTIFFDAADLEASVFDVSVATASIETGNKMQNKHAKSSSWLDAEMNPRISFVSSAFNKTNSEYSVTGNLSINGVTKRVAIPFTFSNSTFTGFITVSREAFEIDGPLIFGGLVGDEIEVSLHVPVK